MLYIKEDENVVQQISDAELEIMKIVWGNPEDVTLFPYIMDGLVARGKPCQKNTLIVLLSRLMNKGFLSAKKIGRRNEYTALVSEDVPAPDPGGDYFGRGKPLRPLRRS